MQDNILGTILADTTAESLTMGGTLLIIGGGLLLGLVISLVYMLTHKNQQYSSGFVVALIMLPAIIAMIILLVGSNVARAFSLAGAFSLIRFRSAAADSKDIAYVFFTLGVGLACGMGYIGYAALFTVILCGVMILLTAVKFGGKELAMELKILVPEDMDFEEVFDDVLRAYARNYRQIRIKTADFGSLFELSYELTLKNHKSRKEFLDELRCKNGNLNIVLHVKETTLTL